MPVMYMQSHVSTPVRMGQYAKGKNARSYHWALWSLSAGGTVYLGRSEICLACDTSRSHRV